MTQLTWTAGLHHDSSALYVSNPYPTLGETVRLRLRAPASAPIYTVYLRTAPDGEQKLSEMACTWRDETCSYWEADLHIRMPSNPYRFRIMAADGPHFLTQLGHSRTEGPDSTDFRLLADFDGPRWTEDAVFYQIFPDRFYNGDPLNDVPPGAWQIGHHQTQQRPWGAPVLHYHEGGNLDYYGGDLQGIVQKLDYLYDLGVNALYLNPIFAARSNHRYDIMDFYAVDPHLGGNEALLHLRHALDSVGMRLVLDVTLNHVGWFNPWFTEAQRTLSAPTAEFFTFHEHPHNYESWLGVRSLPKLNYRSQLLRDWAYRAPESILRFWLREPYRIDGWRLDVANMQARQGAQQFAQEVGREIRRAVKSEAPEAYLLGEHFFDGTPHLQGDDLDATMNYAGFTMPLWRWLAGHDLGLAWDDENGRWPAELMAEQWTRFRAAIPWAIAERQFNLLDSHDTRRLLDTVGGDKTLLKLGASILMTYPGVPNVYYGDEIGLGGGSDPQNRRCMPWDESEWDVGLRDHFKRLIALRRSAPALRHGGYQLLHAQGDLLAYQRHAPEQRLIVVAYRGPGALPPTALPVWQAGLADGAWLVNTHTGEPYQVSEGLLCLDALQAGTALILEER